MKTEAKWFYRTGGSPPYYVYRTEVEALVFIEPRDGGWRWRKAYTFIPTPDVESAIGTWHATPEEAQAVAVATLRMEGVL